MSSSAYPIIWAMKHAPVADALERLILIAMADAADSDGCNSYRSKRSLLGIAVGVDEETIRRRQRAMAKRGLIRPDTSPPPARYLKIPKNRRPPRWEICIPYSWWSDDQREEIQRDRADQGLPPLTSQTRPSEFAPPPPKKARADKGKPNPNRRPKEARQTDESDECGDLSQRGQESGASHRGPQGPLTEAPQGPLTEDQPSFSDLPFSPSPEEPPPPAVGELQVASGERAAADAAESKDSRSRRKKPKQREVPPPPAAVGLYRQLPERLREHVPEHGSRRVLRALAAELEHRTAAELSERISRRSEVWAYRTEDVKNATAVAITIVQRGYDCVDVRCEDHHRLDTGQPCSHCATATPAATETAAVASNSRLPARCGQCVDRWIEEPDGRWRRCPNCHPNAVPTPDISSLA